MDLVKSMNIFIWNKRWNRIEFPGIIEEQGIESSGCSRWWEVPGNGAQYGKGEREIPRAGHSRKKNLRKESFELLVRWVMLLSFFVFPHKVFFKLVMFIFFFSFLQVWVFFRSDLNKYVFVKVCVDRSRDYWDRLGNKSQGYSWH